MNNVETYTLTVNDFGQKICVSQSDPNKRYVCRISSTLLWHYIILFFVVKGCPFKYLKLLFCRFILDSTALVRELNTTSSSTTLQSDNNTIMVESSNLATLLEPPQLG